MLSALENREGLPQIKLCASGQGCGQVLGGVARQLCGQTWRVGHTMSQVMARAGPG